jgi:hypothetical protein
VALEDSWVTVSEVPLDEETADDPAENDTGLGLIVRDKARVLDELGHVDLGDVQTADIWNELRECSSSAWITKKGEGGGISSVTDSPGKRGDPSDDTCPN